MMRRKRKKMKKMKNRLRRSLNLKVITRKSRMRPRSLMTSKSEDL